MFIFTVHVQQESKIKVQFQLFT